MTSYLTIVKDFAKYPAGKEPTDLKKLEAEVFQKIPLRK
jgi:hypothetical protein